jgi:hypothetical protein
MAADTFLPFRKRAAGAALAHWSGSKHFLKSGAHFHYKERSPRPGAAGTPASAAEMSV